MIIKFKKKFYTNYSIKSSKSPVMVLFKDQSIASFKQKPYFKPFVSVNTNKRAATIVKPIQVFYKRRIIAFVKGKKKKCTRDDI